MVKKAEVDWGKYIVKGAVSLIAMVVFVVTKDIAWVATALAPWGSDAVRKVGAVKSIAVLFLLVGFSSCASLPSTFLHDSKEAIQSLGEDYTFNGCAELTMAPEITGSWEGDFHLSGGVLIGCRDRGELVEFYCRRVEGEVKCDSLSTWYREVAE